MLNKLQIYFLGFLFCIALFIICFAVFIPSQSTIHLEVVKFSTSQSSRLYFKNLRSYYYEKEEEEKSGFVLHRYKGEGGNNFQFIIVDNWRHDEAYILAESSVTEINGGDLQIKWNQENQSGTISLKQFDAEAHYVFAAQVYNKLIQGAELFFIRESVSFRLSEKEKKSLKTTLKDFFKLVEKSR